MSKIVQLRGRCVPLRGNDIDTDRIIPARYLRCVTFDGLGEHAFADDRNQLKAVGKTHPFDDPQFAGASVLIAGSNFGCGSSREHAPQSLQKWGIKVILGVSFAEIFYNNNIAIGVPCLTLSPVEVDALQARIEKEPDLEITIDLLSGSVRAGELSFTALMPEGARQMFVRGLWDATGQLLANMEQVKTVAARIPYLNQFAAV